MKILALIALVSAPAFGAWDQIYAEYSDGCVYLGVRSTDAIGDWRMYVDTDPTVSNGFANSARNSTSTRRQDHICLEYLPSTRYYVGFTTSNAAGPYVCTAVDTDGTLNLFGIDMPGWECDVIGNPISFVMGSVQQTSPSPPTLPDITVDLEAQLLGASYTTTYTPTCTAGEITQADFGTALNSAIAALNASCSSWYQVALAPNCRVRLRNYRPNGVTCNGATDTGGIVVETNGSELLLIPDSTSSDPSFTPYYATISGDGLYPYQLLFRNLILQPNSGGFRRIFFRRLNFLPGNLPGEIDAQFNFTGMASTTTLNVSGMVPDDSNKWEDAARVTLRCDTPSEDTAGLTGNHTCSDCDIGDSVVTISTTFDNSTACASGGQVVARPTGYAVSAIATNGTIDFSIDHDLVQYPAWDMTVTDLGDDARIVLDSAMPSPGGSDWVSNGDVVRVEGTGLGIDGALCEVFNKTSSTTFDLQDCDPAGTSATGTVRKHESFSIQHTSNAAVNKVWHYEYVDRNTVRLLNADGTYATLPSGITGGYGAWEPDVAGFIFELAKSSNIGWGIYQSNFQCGVFPLRGTGCITSTAAGAGPSFVLLKNNYFSGPQTWYRRDPVSNTNHFGPGIAQNTNSQIFSQNSWVDEITVTENKFHACGIFCSAGSDDSVSDNGDWEWSRNVHYYPHWQLTNHDSYRGLRQAVRHHFESKGGAVIRIRGNHFINQQKWLSGNPTGAIVLKGRTSQTSLASLGRGGNFHIQGNVFDRTAETILFSPYDSFTTFDGAHGPIAILDNWATIDYYNTLPGAPPTASESGGSFFRAFRGLGSTDIQRNTILHVTSYRALGYLFHWNGFSSFSRFEKNIFVHNGIASDGINRRSISAENLNGTPSLVGSNNGPNYWDWIHQRPGDNGAQGDALYSTFDDNVLIGGIEALHQEFPALTTDYASTVDGDTVTSTETSTYYSGIHTTTANQFPSGSSLDARLDVVFESGSWEPRSAYSGYGASLANLRRWTGYPGSLPTLSEVNSTTVRFTMDGPVDLDGNEFGCYVDLSTDADFSVAGNITRKRFASAAGDQTLDFTVAAASHYYWRTHCPVTRYFGEIQTQ